MDDRKKSGGIDGPTITYEEWMAELHRVQMPIAKDVLHENAANPEQPPDIKFDIFERTLTERNLTKRIQIKSNTTKQNKTLKIFKQKRGVMKAKREKTASYEKTLKLFT